MSDRKVALVTGGSMGLGKAVAEQFRAMDYEVVTCARSGDVSYHVDVQHLDQIAEMAGEILRQHGHIEVLVNNAAVYGPVGQIDALNPNEWWEAVRINLLGPMLMARVVLPAMRRQGHGKIINISGAGVRPQPECTAYNASKAGLLRFTEALAADLEGTGINVNSIAPGVLDTRMRLRSALPDNPDSVMWQAVAAIVWLASEASNGITGRLFSAVWDDLPWCAKGRGPLGKDDYRMRRVVPE